MSSLAFEVVFHGPFRVGTGNAVPGAHQTAWRDGAGEEVLIAPGSTVKGVMRAAAAEVISESLVNEVFGSAGQQCPWGWSALTVPGSAVHGRLRTRVEIDPTTGTVARDMLAVAEELVVDVLGRFTVDRLGFACLAVTDRPRHEAVLRVAAGLVTGMGGTRRRGLGWVSIRPIVDDPARTLAESVATLPELTGGAA